MKEGGARVIKAFTQEVTVGARTGLKGSQPPSYIYTISSL